MKNNEKKMAIITYIDKNYEENLEYDFLKTLFEKAHFCGKVVIIDYGMDKYVSDRIKMQYGRAVEIIQCCPKSSIFSARYRDIKEVIDNLDDKVEVVMTVDGGDVWFQGGLSSLSVDYSKKIGLAGENRVWGNDDWTNACFNCIHADEREHIMSVLKGMVVYNSGLIIGNKVLVRDFIDRVYKNILEYGHEFFGIDQIYADYEYALWNESEKQNLNDIFNFVVVSNKDRYYLQDEEVYRIDGSKVVVVHNAGGNWRVLDRPFKNMWKNETQYYIRDKNLFSTNMNIKEDGK